MDRLIAPNTVAVGSGDTAPLTGTPGQATDGNPASGIPATNFPAYAFNAIQEEIIAVLAAGGITPNRSSNVQLLAAINAVIAGKFTFNGGANGYMKLPLGLIMQWGQIASSASADMPVAFPIAFPTGILFLSVNPGSTGQGFFGNFNSESRTDFNLATWSAGTTRAASSVRWFSLGY